MPRGKERPKRTYDYKIDGTQLHFFDKVPERPIWQGGSTIPGNPDADFEKLMGKWDRAFNGRGLNGKDARAKILQKDANHWWNEFLKDLGYTDKNRTQRQLYETKVALQRLDQAGVLELLHSKMTLEEQTSMVKVLDTFDRDHNMTWRKWLDRG
jgi:hypothetical protein